MSNSTQNIFLVKIFQSALEVKNPQKMEIAAIKEKLGIEQVLRHYGISIGKNNHITQLLHYKI